MTVGIHRFTLSRGFVKAIVMAIVVLLGGACVVIAAASSLLVRNKYESPGRRLLRIISACLVIYGALAFFGQALITVAGNYLLSPRMEWPVGYASEVPRDSTGRYIVLLRNVERIQVYDKECSFLHGWSLPGKNFKVRITPGDRIEVFGSGKKLIYDPDGWLLGEESYIWRTSVRAFGFKILRYAVDPLSFQQPVCRLVDCSRWRSWIPCL
jgi:hypothetical protein